ncbi:MAG: glycerol dehydrogenase [Anaerovoracaceae bacterium]|jgi:glycerol dehydrogenase
MKHHSIAFGSPGRYIQGEGELYRLPEHAAGFGKKIFAVIDEFFFDDYSKSLNETCRAKGASFDAYRYSVEITKERIHEAADQAEGFGADVITGIGGGKTIDTAKAAASVLGLPLIIVPTSASTDAPTSAMSVIYNDRHEHDDVWYYRKNPDLVLVDTRIIADAPPRFLISGMGDALATAYEGRASIRSGSPNYIEQSSGPYFASRTAVGIAELCRDTILQNGRAAKEAAVRHEVTKELEAVVEANTLMSGLGFENVGCAGSHVICNGISRLPGGEKALHGEKVAFGILCQLTAEQAPEAELAELRSFYLDVGLPLTLEDLGIEASDENIDKISRDAKNTEWTREPFELSDEDVCESIRRTERDGLLW